MAALDSYYSLDGRIEFRWIHRAPVWDLHHAPPTSRAAPTVIVRACNDRKVERVGELDDIGSLSLDHTDTLGRRVTQLNRVQSRESSLLIGR